MLHMHCQKNHVASLSKVIGAEGRELLLAFFLGGYVEVQSSY